jgi:hypothetical protein
LARGERPGSEVHPSTRRILERGFGVPVDELLAAWQGESRDEPRPGSSSLELEEAGFTDRRRVLTGTASVLAPALLGFRIGGVARALTPYAFAPPPYRIDRVPTVHELVDATAGVKRAYQACQYSTALDQMPSLVTAVQAALAETRGDDHLAAQTAAAGAYQVVGSVMLKVGDPGLATLAADQSMRAALASLNPVTVAASARVVTHALMSSGHNERATELAMAAAQRLDKEQPHPDPAALSVYGALLLRGAVAAARADDRGTTTTLLDEADAAATRLGRDDNAEWTAFGPTNVMLHRVNVAVLLGDLGLAIDLAKRVEVGRIALPERRAALFLDMAHAYSQWGKLELALYALTNAEQTAPEELQNRASVRTLLADISRRGNRRIQAAAHAVAERVGIAS